MANISDLSHAAEPTKFHHLLRMLDEHNQLLRVYTQNIDALEEKAGLSFGLSPMKAEVSTTSTSAPSSQSPTPRCIPLHGTLQQMRCELCGYLSPLRDHIQSLAGGSRPPCPQCASLEEARRLEHKRARAVGSLRPDIVLYNEYHKDGETIAEIVGNDLPRDSSSEREKLTGADLLLVVGTSLQIPGTKDLVRQFSKAIFASRGVDNSTRPGDLSFGASELSLCELTTMLFNSPIHIAQLGFPISTEQVARNLQYVDTGRRPVLR